MNSDLYVVKSYHDVLLVIRLMNPEIPKNIRGKIQNLFKKP